MIQFLVENSLATVALFDRGLNRLAASPQWMAEVGAAESDFTRRSRSGEVGGPAELWRRAHEGAMQGRTTSFRNESPGPPVRRWDVQPLYGSTGDVVSVMIASDVVADLASEGLPGILLERVPVALALFDRDLRCLLANREWSRELTGGISRVGLPLEQGMPHCPAVWQEAHRLGLAGEGQADEEAVWARDEPEPRWTRQRTRAWNAADGSIGGIALCVDDVTDREKAKRTALDFEDYFKRLLDTAVDAILLIDQQGLIDKINPAAERMFGFDHDEMLGMNVTEVMSPVDRSEHNGYLARYVEVGSPHLVGRGREVVGRRKDGTWIGLDLAVSHIVGDGFLGILRQLPERDGPRERLLEIATDQQRSIGRELHDGVQQELTGLSLFAGTLVDALERVEPGVPIDPAILERLRSAAERLRKGLSDSHRNVRRLAHGIMPIRILATALRTSLVDLTVGSDESHRIECVVKCPDPVDIFSDATATHLYRIAQEALNNATKHSKANTIVVSLLNDRKNVVLKIEDDGVGFDPNDIRSDSPDGGLGLRSMEYRAGVIGGTLLVESEPGGGTRVTCTLARETRT